MTVLELLTTLRALDVKLTPLVDRLRVDAPTGVLTPALHQTIRMHKAELLDLLEAFEERVGIAQYCGGLSRPEAERQAWACLLEAQSHAGCAACGYASSAETEEDVPF
jgi:hypothetical protein